MKKHIKLKIELDSIEPTIWREIIVSSEITLHEFHQIIQDAMGWMDYHLYEFEIGGAKYSIPSEDDDIFEMEIHDSNSILLKNLNLKKNSTFKYVYDFGDYWRHTIQVKQLLPYQENANVPVCVAGARNCPPEDCGSCQGYEEFCKAMSRPNSKQAKEYIMWYGGLYDPEYFSLYDRNREILKGFFRNKF